MGFGVLGIGPNPNSQSPIPNPQSPYENYNLAIILSNLKNIKKINLFNLIKKNNEECFQKIILFVFSNNISNLFNYSNEIIFKSFQRS
jgi:hypothetical protein